MQAINGAFNFVFDILLLEFLGLPKFWGLAFLSILFGLVALLAFKKISNQKAIRAAKDRIWGHLMEIILYKDDVRVVATAQFKVMRYNLAYLGHNSIPMIALVIPFVFVVMNLDPRLRYSPIDPGQEAIVTATLRENVSFDGLDVALDAPDGVAVEAGPVRAADARTVDWRVRADDAGIYELSLRVNDATETKRLVVGESVKMLAPKREGGNPFLELANPGEPVLAGTSPFEKIAVNYARGQTIPVFGIDMHWVLVFLLVSLAFGFAIKGALGVEI